MHDSLGEYYDRGIQQIADRTGVQNLVAIDVRMTGDTNGPSR